MLTSLFLSLAIGSVSPAQSQSLYPDSIVRNDVSPEWTLDRCINHALSHNITIKQRTLDNITGDIDITDAKDRFLPQVSAGANQSLSFGRGLTSENTYANRNTTNFGWNVGLSLPIFQGLSAVRRLDYAKANLRVLVEQLEAAKDDVTLNVISQYLQTLYCKEMVAVAAEQVRISQVEVERRTALLEAGKIPELDLVEARSQLAQDEVSLVNAENNHALALLDLAQLLELPTTAGFDIQPLGEEALLQPIPSIDEVWESAYGSNHSLLASRRSVEAADRNISLAKTGYIPTLSFSAGLGSSYYTVSGYDNSSFSHQMRDNFNKSLGFSLHIPIFDAFSTRNSTRRARVQKLNAELALDNAERNLYKAIQQAYYQAVAAERKFHSSITASESARMAFEAMQQKYDYGRANATEFEQAKSTYIKAQADAVQSKYETILRTRILNFYARR